ncbi:MAG: SafA/ExsA family spore coat assembly protein [Clostridiales bacterium]|nr:SafA/ExsA family spore coat assembly protein [Clostridiales bacterium]
MKKLFAAIAAAAVLLAVSSVSAAQVHSVAPGDSMWKISVRYQTGLSEIIEANPQIQNPELIYPGQTINIPATDSSVRAYEKEVVRLVNVERAKYGIAPLTEDWELSRVARYKSQDMRDSGYFSHNSPTYGSPFTMIKNFGLSYRTAAENIAKGQGTPAEVVKAWINSSGHRSNILNKSFTKIGVGYVKSGNYWTQMFIG